MYKLTRYDFPPKNKVIENIINVIHFFPGFHGFFLKILIYYCMDDELIYIRCMIRIT